MRIRLLLSLALSALAATAVALPAATGAVKIPKGVKTAKVTQYPVTIDTVGYLDYTWTFDTTKQCSVGYFKTVDESLSFELGTPRKAKVSVVNGKVILFPVKGGEGTVTTELTGWRTTNYCPPQEPAKEPPEPTCKKKLRSPIAVGVGPVLEPGGGEELAPLVMPTQVLISRTKPSPQTHSCRDQRPKIQAEEESARGWVADPQLGITAPLGATDADFRRLAVGATLKRTVSVSGGCGKATFSTGKGGGPTATIPSTIKSCVVKGKAVVMIKRTGAGFGT